MKKINEIIVVEGKSDKQFLETFLNADILTCNGSAIDGFDKNYLMIKDNFTIRKKDVISTTKIAG